MSQIRDGMKQIELNWEESKTLRRAREIFELARTDGEDITLIEDLAILVHLVHHLDEFIRSLPEIYDYLDDYDDVDWNAEDLP